MTTINNIYKPTRLKVNQLGIDISNDAVLGTEYLVVGENTTNVGISTNKSFSLIVDSKGIAINRSRETRLKTTAGGPFALEVSGKTYINDSLNIRGPLNFINENNVTIASIGIGIGSTGITITNNTGIGSGIASDSFWRTAEDGVGDSAIYYTGNITVGPFEHSSSNPYKINIVDEISDISNAQFAIQNKNSGVFRIGIIGDDSVSPVIFNTLSNSPMEFHVGSFTGGTFSSRIPNLNIDGNGNVGIRTSSNYDITFRKFVLGNNGLDPKTETPTFHVEGTSYFKDILMLDYATAEKKHLDEIYVRREGLTFDASNVIPGVFAPSPFTFTSNVYITDTENSNLSQVRSSVDSNVSLYATGNIHTASDLIVDGTMTAANAVLQNNVNFNDNIFVQNNVFFKGSLFKQRGNEINTDGTPIYDMIQFATNSLVRNNNGVMTALFNDISRYDNTLQSKWVERPLKFTTNNQWRSIVWAEEKGFFVAIASTGENKQRIMASINGVDWNIYQIRTDDEWQSIAWAPPNLQEGNGGYFIAVASSGTDRIITINFPDASSFTDSSFAPSSELWTDADQANYIELQNDWRSVVWAPELGLFVAVASSGQGNRVMTGKENIATGTDSKSITLTPRRSAADNYWQSVAWSPDLELFVAVASSGSQTDPVNNPDLEDRVMISNTGSDWETRSVKNNNWTSVIWADKLGLFVAVASSGLQRVMTSNDGLIWNYHNCHKNNWTSVVFANKNESDPPEQDNPHFTANDTIESVNGWDASDHWNVTANYNSDEAYKAFNNIEDSYTTTLVYYDPVNLSITYPYPVVLKSFTFNGITDIEVLPKNWVIQFSSDNITWTDIEEYTDELWTDIVDASKTFNITNSAPYKYWRINITAVGTAGSGPLLSINQLVFTTIKPDQDNPNFTANDTIASGNGWDTLDDWNVNATYNNIDAYKAFNNIDDPYTTQLFDVNIPATLSITYPYPVVLKSFTFNGITDIEVLPKNWVIQFSSDNIRWTDVAEYTDELWTDIVDASKTFNITNSDPYKYWRIRIIAVGGTGTVLTINQLVFTTIKQEQDNPIFADDNSTIESDNLWDISDDWNVTANYNSTDAYKAFNNNLSDPYTHEQEVLDINDEVTIPVILSIKYPYPVVLKSFTFDGFEQKTKPNLPKNWKIQFSSDNLTWTDVATYTNVEYATDIAYSKTFNITTDDKDAYKYWRIRITAVGNDNNVLTINQLVFTTITIDYPLLVAVSWTGEGNRVMTSKDGIYWQTQKSVVDYNWSSIAWSPSLELFVAVSISDNISNLYPVGDGIGTSGKGIFGFDPNNTQGDETNHQVVIIKRDLLRFELELTDKSDPFYRRTAYIGHPRVGTGSNFEGDGSLVFLTSEQKYGSSTNLFDQNRAQNFYFYPKGNNLPDSNGNVAAILPANFVINQLNPPAFGVFPRKIGINTFNPQHEVHVEGSILVSGKYYYKRNATDTTGSEIGLWNVLTNFGISYSNRAAPYVGINENPNSNYSLTVSGDIRSDGYYTRDGIKILQFFDSSNISSISNVPYTNACTNGRLGIGVLTNASSSTLHIKDSSNNTSLKLSKGTNNNSIFIHFDGEKVDYSWHLNDSNEVFELNYNNSTDIKPFITRYNNNKSRHQVIINSNIGFTTTNDDAVLFVNGDVHIKGNINVSNGYYKLNGTEITIGMGSTSSGTISQQDNPIFIANNTIGYDNGWDISNDWNVHANYNSTNAYKAFNNIEDPYTTTEFNVNTPATLSITYPYPVVLKSFTFNGITATNRESLPKNWAIQFSSDNDEWKNLATYTNELWTADIEDGSKTFDITNSDPYKYWRILITEVGSTGTGTVLTINQLVFTTTKPEQDNPNFTANDTIVSANGWEGTSGYWNVDANYNSTDAYKAFNNVQGESYTTVFDVDTSVILSITYPYPVVLKSFKFNGITDKEVLPKNWVIEFSSDNIKWTDIAEYTDELWTDDIEDGSKTFDITNTNAYQYWRILITEVGNSGTVLTINQLVFTTTKPEQDNPIFADNNTVASANIWDTLDYWNVDANYNSINAYKAFNNIKDPYTIQAFDVDTSATLSITYPYPVVLKSFTFNGIDTTNRESLPKNWEIQFSSDNDEWENLATYTGELWTDIVAGSKMFDITNSDPYKYWRILITEVGTGSVLTINQLVFTTYTPIPQQVGFSTTSVTNTISILGSNVFINPTETLYVGSSTSISSNDSAILYVKNTNSNSIIAASYNTSINACMSKYTTTNDNSILIGLTDTNPFFVGTELNKPYITVLNTVGIGSTTSSLNTVGIGVTDPDTSSLNVVTTSETQSLATFTRRLMVHGVDEPADISLEKIINTTKYSWKLQGPNSTHEQKLQFIYEENDSSGSTNNISNEVVCITKDGHIGIGTSKPAYAIDIQNMGDSGSIRMLQDRYIEGPEQDNPNFTANNTIELVDGWVASDVWNVAANYNSINAYKAFNNVQGESYTYEHSIAFDINNPVNLSITYPYPVLLKSFTFKGINTNNKTLLPTKWEIEYSSDNENWGSLKPYSGGDGNGETWNDISGDTVEKEFVIDIKSEAYKYWRINITAVGGDGTKLSINQLVFTTTKPETSSRPQLIFQTGSAVLGNDIFTDYCLYGSDNSFTIDSRDTISTNKTLLNFNSNGNIGIRTSANDNYNVSINGTLNVSDNIFIQGRSFFNVRDPSDPNLMAFIRWDSISILPTANDEIYGGVIINGSSNTSNIFQVNSGNNGNIAVFNSTRKKSYVHLRSTSNDTGIIWRYGLNTENLPPQHVNKNNSNAFINEFKIESSNINSFINDDSAGYIRANELVIIKHHNLDITNELLQITHGSIRIKKFKGDTSNINNESGNGYVEGNFEVKGYLINDSDRRIKNDIRPIENALEKIKKLSGYTFKKGTTGKRETGVIAQEVAEVLPEAVFETNDGILGVAYGNLAGILIEAIKELSQQIEEIKRKL